MFSKGVRDPVPFLMGVPAVSGGSGDWGPTRTGLLGKCNKQNYLRKIGLIYVGADSITLKSN